MERATVPAAPLKQHQNAHAPLVERFFSREGTHPFDEVAWTTRKVTVRGTNGAAEERELEFPEFWSENAAEIAGSKYFRGRVGSAERESSVRQMIGRVVKTVREWGLRFHYFADDASANTYADELAYVLVHQRAAFNSPVWFNVGIDAKPQCSACFILSVEDSMESILEWITTEGLIFKRGSGAGVNLSPLRSTKETLSRGGHSSGPVSFMRGADAVAGMIASGGSTRRAAKMVILNVDHPDIMRFIRVKSDEEKKVRALIDAGYNMFDLNDPAWNSIQYQNANNSVRVTDLFMQAVEQDEAWRTRRITDGAVADAYKARDVFHAIAENAWNCGDPGLQFDTTINRWHTCPASGRINGSNPCSEYMHVDNSACNLSSINLLHYLTPEGKFDVEGFRRTVDIMLLAQEILVDGSAYPTPRIAKNAHDFRQLGLGYANLGAVLMSLGIPYDSDEARHTAAAITALMTGEAYRFSAHLARDMHPFARFQENREPLLKVLHMHRDALQGVDGTLAFDGDIVRSAREAWDGAVADARRWGVRNAQVSVLAPTGTIALMMDCVTTGVEPEFALVKMKRLVGGGMMKFVNNVVSDALRAVGYGEAERAAIAAYIEARGTAEGAPGLREEHLPVFDCAVKPAKGTRSISWKGHVKMVAAVQPFLSGAISKTFNMPHETTVEEVEQALMMGWKLGLKAFAVYRDGSKAAQPLFTGAEQGKGTQKKEQKPARRHLPATRPSETHKFSIAGHEGYLTYSMFEDGGLAEIFIRMSKQGSTLAGLLDAFAIVVSTALRYGVPVATLAQKFSYGRYEPAGFTKNPEVQVATSITDYIFRYLAIRFLSADELEGMGIKVPHKGLDQDEKVPAMPIAQTVAVKTVAAEAPASAARVYADSVCRACGGMLIQTGSCKTCIQCGSTSGACS
ncbi:MAG: vitamin B12-dependent ribonucleotide reductase [Candidatus Liptonbacteria bacterium]|nr:vitamin B12-dependent ribonucleotide reductase [Candidatus Liptonbacteria bacterium]